MHSRSKYELVLDRCSHMTPSDLAANPGECPPDPQVLLLEVVCFACFPMAATGMFLVWWLHQWKEDCQCLLRALPAGCSTPLEALMRRNALLSHREVRDSDLCGRGQRILMVGINTLLSYFVVLTSFFFLWHYETPGKLTAWNPYKVIFESFVAFAIKLVIKKIVIQQAFGRFTLCFLWHCIIVFTVAVVYLWFTVYRTCTKLGLHSRHNVILMLDIVLGAGVLNLLFSSVFYSMCLHFFSVYYYEPMIRSRSILVLRLTSPAEVADLHDWYLSTGQWVLHGQPMQAQREVRLSDLRDLRDESRGNERRSVRLKKSHSISEDESEGSEVDEQLCLATPCKDQPVFVELRRASQSVASRVLIKLTDKICSVEPAVPVYTACWTCTEQSRAAYARSSASGGLCVDSDGSSGRGSSGRGRSDSSSGSSGRDSRRSVTGGLSDAERYAQRRSSTTPT
mmetsp:Transcript_42342/g.133595  ORF Transcript_42342/g.133595 Transcript_42342/m.133595 type:complete len:453 (-) Transcript_42342:36-1394(-)